MTRKDERAFIIKETFDELPFCIGYKDGAEFKLAETPIHNLLDYFFRKHKYSVKAQTASNHKLRIRHVCVRAPGTLHDACIYLSCPFFQLFCWESLNYRWLCLFLVQYSYYITPFKRNHFHLRDSRHRLCAQHCIGLLKERFGSLKVLRHCISNVNNKRFCSQCILNTTF